MKKLALTTLLLLAAAPALAETPRWGSFQFRYGSFRPDLDAEFVGKLGCGPVGAKVDCTPYRDIFGTGRNAAYELAVARSLTIGPWGTVDLGAGLGWSTSTGHGLKPDGTASGDKTTLRLLPLSVSLTFRYDYLARSFPLVPYGRVSALRTHWWVTNGAGGTATALTDGRSGEGATNGWGWGAGVAFLLDFLDPALAREMDRDLGINRTYLFVEAGRTRVNDFGSRTSWDLSDDRGIAWSGGILFVF